DCSRWGRLFGPSLESQEPNRRTIEQKGTCDTPFYGAEAPWTLSPTEVTDLSSACSPSFPLFELRVETCSTFSITPSWHSFRVILNRFSIPRNSIRLFRNPERVPERGTCSGWGQESIGDRQKNTGVI